MPKKVCEELCFQAIKYKCIEDEDGEVSIVFKVNMQDKLSAIVIPVKELLNIKVKKADV